MSRVWHPYHEWEDYQSGMYRQPEDLVSQSSLAAGLLSNSDGLREAMHDAVSAWPTAAEHYLTDLSSNRRAWVGQAACQYALNVPSQATRNAWWTLTEEQRDAANEAADIVIREWEEARDNAETLFG